MTQRAQEATDWWDTIRRFLQSKSVPELLWVSTSFGEERSFAAGAAYGFAGTMVDAMLAPFELVKMLVYADLYESLCLPWESAIRAAQSLPGPLGYLAFRAQLSHEYFEFSRPLRAAYEEREHLLQQLGRFIQHPFYYLAEFAESAWDSLKSKWTRYQTLRGKHDTESQFQAGVLFGQIVGELVLAFYAVRWVVAAASKLARELPELFKQLKELRFRKGGRALSEGGSSEGGSGKGGSGEGNSASEGGESKSKGNGKNESKPAEEGESGDKRTSQRKPANKGKGGGDEGKGGGDEGKGGDDAKGEGPKPNPPPGGEPAPEPNAPPGGDDPNPVPRDESTSTGHPVDVATGKVFTDKLDVELPGLLGFRWERVWFSTSTYDGPLGHGWHHTYDAWLHESDDAVHYHTDDGRTVVFPLLGLGGEHYHRTERVALTRGEDGYSLRSRDELVSRFSRSPADRTRYLLRSIEHPAGRRLQLQRDGSGLLTQIIDGAGRSIALAHDSKGRIESISIPDPNDPAQSQLTVQYEYAHGDLVRVSDALGKHASYRYAQHQLVQETDRAGLSFYFEYDGPGPRARCVRTWGDGAIYDHKLTYDVARGLTTVENSLGAKTLYEHRGGLVIRSVDPLGATRLTEYDEFNRRRREVDALGHVTEFFYDARGNLIRTLRADGVEVRATFDASDRLLSFQEGELPPWLYTRDACGRLLERTDPRGAKTRFRYEGALLSGVVDANGERYRLSRDTQGNLTAVHAPDGSVRRWQHDALGRVRTAIDAAGNTLRVERDALGRVTRVEEPDGNVNTTVYDAEGRLVHARDKRRDVRFTYQGMGRLASRREASTTVFFEYDTEERLVAVHNEHGRVYRFQRDVRGEIATEVGFDGARRVFTTDLLGQTTQVTRAGGSTSRYVYDPLGRILRAEHSDGDYTNYEYAVSGELVRADNGLSDVKFERDACANIVREQQGNDWIESEYDPCGMRIRVRSSLGLDQRIARDAIGRVSAVDVGAFQMQVARDVLGLEIERMLPGGARSQWQRDQLGRPLKHALRTAEQTVRSISYSWEVGGRLRELVDSEHGLVRYGYDTRGSLAWARYTDGSAELRMPDAVGNLYRSEDRSDRKYGAGGELLEAIDRRGRVTRYRYDADGNLVEKVEAGSRRWRYVWNAAGRLVNVERPDGTRVEFAYDGIGRRIEKRYRGQTTRFAWDRNVPLHEWVEGELEPLSAAVVMLTASSVDYAMRKREAELETHLAQGPPERGARSAPITWLFEAESHVPMARLVGAECQSIVTDHVGTPTTMFDERGARVWSATMGVYGDLHTLKGQRQACPFRWQGQYEDAETGLYYNRFRYYDPNSGQYISQDPIRLAGGHAVYGYCADPLGWVDPFGLCGDTPDGTFRDANGRLRNADGTFAPDGGPKKVPGNGTHGNTAGDQEAALYEKYDKDGNFLKHGISQDPNTRYTQKELDGGYVVETDRGPRKDMLKKERDLVETNPGPENKEPWAGKRKPGP